MSAVRLDEAGLTEGLAHLCRLDADLARAVETCGTPPLRTAEAGFPALLRSIVAQQVSVHAARSIWLRLTDLIGPPTPQAFLAAGADQLRGAGLSGQKVRYGLALAAAIAEGSLDLEAVQAMADEEAIVELVKAKGIGRWTAEIYLMFALGRADIFPAADLGLIVAAQSLKGLEARPSPAEMTEMARPWGPWRSVASLILWHYRHNMPDMAVSRPADAPAPSSRRG